MIRISFVWPLENHHRFISQVNVESGKRQCKHFRRALVNFYFPLPHFSGREALGSTLEDSTPRSNGEALVVGSKESWEDLSSFDLSGGYLKDWHKATAFALPNSEFSQGGKAAMQRAFIKNIERQMNPADWGKILQWKQTTEYIQVWEEKSFFGESDY